MKILVTGSDGFLGKNIVEALNHIMHDRKKQELCRLNIEHVYLFNHSSTEKDLDEVCGNIDFVIHLAGVNRPDDETAYRTENVGLLQLLIKKLILHSNTCPIMFASSIQASLNGRYADSKYGQSKKICEELLFEYSKKYGCEVYVFRFPNIFGKWCKPNYNSVVATICNAIANDSPYHINDRNAEIELVYIDDVLKEILSVLKGYTHRCDYIDDGFLVRDDGKYCYVPNTYHATLGEVVDELESFRDYMSILDCPNLQQESFRKKLFSTFVSYLPLSKTIFQMESSNDNRGSFTEVLRTSDNGQISINITKPGVTKGNHWHNSKLEIFIVVSGHGLIRERKIGINPATGQKYEERVFDVHGESLSAVYMIPGYTHSITNLSQTQELVTIIWANEKFDESNPDTFYEEV